MHHGCRKQCHKTRGDKECHYRGQQHLWKHPNSQHLNHWQGAEKSPHEYEAAVHCSIWKKWWKSKGATIPVCTGKTCMSMQQLYLTVNSTTSYSDIQYSKCDIYTFAMAVEKNILICAVYIWCNCILAKMKMHVIHKTNFVSSGYSV